MRAVLEFRADPQRRAGMAKGPELQRAAVPMQIADDGIDLTAADADSYRSPMAGAINSYRLEDFAESKPCLNAASGTIHRCLGRRRSSPPRPCSPYQTYQGFFMHDPPVPGPPVIMHCSKEVKVQVKPLSPLLPLYCTHQGR